MMETLYLNQPVPVEGSDLVIVALSREGSPYLMKERYYTGLEEVDLPQSFPALSYLVRKAEAGEDVPDYEELRKATKKALVAGGDYFRKLKKEG